MLPSKTYIQSTKLDRLYPCYDVIVIGAGIAGLICAAFLAKKWKKGVAHRATFYPRRLLHFFLRGRVLTLMQPFIISEAVESGVSLDVVLKCLV